MTGPMVILFCLEFLLVLLGQPAVQASLCNQDNITFLSYFPCTDLPEGNASHFVETCDLLTYVAARVAMDEINSREDILNGSFVNLVPFATRKASTVRFNTDDPEAVVFHSATYLNELRTVHGVIGPGDPDVTKLIAPLASSQSNTIQMLYEVAGNSYPFLFSTLPSDVFLNEARLSLLLKFRWIKLATLASSEEAYLQAHENFNMIYQRAIHPNLIAVVSTSFDDSPDFALQEIRRSGTQIIFGFFGPSNARKVLCRARLFGLNTTEHVWILPSYYSPGWWRLEAELDVSSDDESCSNQDMADILNSTLFLGAIKLPLINEVSTADFHVRLMDKTVEMFPDLEGVDLRPLLLTSHAWSAYEAVWLLALAWNSCHTCQDEESLRAALNQSVWTAMYCEQCRMYLQCFATSDNSDCQMCMNSKDGMFNNSAHNVCTRYYGQVLVSQFVGNRHCPIGFFWPGSNSNLEFVTFSDLGSPLSPQLQEDAAFFVVPECPMNFTWKGGSRPTGNFSLTVSSISLSNLVIVTVLSLCGFAYAITLLVLNFVWKKNKNIKASSPMLNVVIIIGYMMYLPAPLLWGWGVLSGLEYNLTLTEITVCCQLAEWMSGTIAPVLVYATLLVKNLRLYQIFYNKQLRQDIGKKCTDSVLLAILLILTAPVVILLILQTTIDPLHAIYTNGSRTNDIYDFQFVNVSICADEYEYIWMSFKALYRLFLTVALLFLTFHNSRISTGINRFKEEAVAAYQTLIIIIFVEVIFSIFLDVISVRKNLLEYKTLFWLIVVATVPIPTIFITVIFTPKFIAMYRDHVKTVKKKRCMSESTKIVKEHEYLKSKAHELREELEKKEKRIASLKKIRIQVSALKETQV